MKNVYLYVLDTLSDREPAQIAAELNSGNFFKKPGKHLPVITVALDHKPITTMGGLTVTPDMTLDEVTADSAAAFLIPGSNEWDNPRHVPAVEKAHELLRADNTVIGAICGATAMLANAGLLNDRPHTSNALEFLEAFCPAYTGRPHYRHERAVADGNLVTASGAGSLQWARLLLEKLDVFAPATLEAWYKHYETGDPKQYLEMMQSLPGR